MLTELERQQLRSALIELLDYVVEVCNRNELDYILVGGTLLGAIRHNGFIPWDDDIDVSLPRKHYEKLIMELKKSSNEKYFLHDWSNDENYNNLFAQFKLNNSCIVGEAFNPKWIHHGITIDIFPLDSLPKKTDLRQKLISFLIKQVFKGILHYRDLGYFSGFKVEIKRRPLRYILRVLILIITSKLERKKIIKILYKLMTYFENSPSKNFYTNYTGPYPTLSETNPINSIWPSRKHTFEQGIYNIPKNYDVFLKNLYGNYQKLPPEEERLSHHGFKSINFNQNC